MTDTPHTEKTVSQLSRVIVVKPGDTLSSIAAQFYDDESLCDALANANGIARSAILTAGTKIKVPHRASFAKKRLPHHPNHKLGAVGEPLTEVTVTGIEPWYLNKNFWMGMAGGAFLTYLLFNSKKIKLF